MKQFTLSKSQCKKLKKYKANLEITEIHTDTYHITAHLNFINEKMKWEYASIDLGKEFNFE